MRKRNRSYNGLSANAKRWLLVKHHFATSSVFQQHVKDSALTSFSPTTSLSVSLLLLLSLDEVRVDLLHPSGEQLNTFRSQALGWICPFTCGQRFVSTQTHRLKEKKKKRNPYSFQNAHSAVLSLRTNFHDSYVSSQMVWLNVVKKAKSVTSLFFSAIVFLCVYFHFCTINLQTLLYIHPTQSHSNLF